MPSSDVNINLDTAKVTDLALGDWVQYPNNTLGSVGYSVQGISRTYNPASYTGGWRVMSNNGTNVKLISANNVPTLYVSNSSFTTSVSACTTSFLNSTYATTTALPSTSNYTALSAIGLASPDSITTEQGDTSLYRKYLSGEQQLISTNEVAISKIRMTVTLKNGLYITGGNGTKSDPYVLSLNK